MASRSLYKPSFFCRGHRGASFYTAFCAFQSLISAVCFFAGGFTAAKAQILGGEEFRPVLWGPSALPTDIIEYSSDVTSPGGVGGLRYVNVVRDDGTWVVQNFLVGFEPGTRKIATGFNSSLFDPNPARRYQTTLDISPLSAAPGFIGGTARSLLSSTNYQENNPFGRTDAGALGPPGPGPQPPRPPGPPQPMQYSFHAGIPDIPQGTNECAPTSAADSITWLNATQNLGLTMTTEQIRDSLKKFMMTSAADGTLDRNVAFGKVDYFIDRKLNIEVHVIGGGGKTPGTPSPGFDQAPSIHNLLQEMQNGQDIELSLGWYDPTGKRTGGHWVTLAGICVAGDLDHPSGVTINYIDPDDKKNQIKSSPLEFIAAENLWKISNEPNNRLEFALAESVVPEPSTIAACGLGFGLMITLVQIKKRRLQRRKTVRSRTVRKVIPSRV